MATFGALATAANASVMRVLADSALVINGTASVPAIWREPTQTMLESFDAPVPMATIAASAFPAIARDDQVVRGGTQYRVIGVEPDGYGLVTLRLERAA